MTNMEPQEMKLPTDQGLICSCAFAEQAKTTLNRERIEIRVLNEKSKFEETEDGRGRVTFCVNLHIEAPKEVAWMLGSNDILFATSNYLARNLYLEALYTYPRAEESGKNMCHPQLAGIFDAWTTLEEMTTGLVNHFEEQRLACLIGNRHAPACSLSAIKGTMSLLGEIRKTRKQHWNAELNHRSTRMRVLELEGAEQRQDH